MSTPRNRHGALRVVRGGLLAISSGALAISAHALADGGLPDPALTLTLTGLIGWLGTALADRTRGAIGVLAVLGAVQLAMHVVLTNLAHHPGRDGGSMTFAHAAATVLTALLIARAESMLLVAVASLWLLLPIAWRPAPVPAGPVRPTLPRPAHSSMVGVVLRRICGRRGPPLFS